MSLYSENLRRLMAREGMTLRDVADRCRLDERTIKTILSGDSTPHARTLHKLSQGLGVAVDELFQTPSALAYRSFDRQSNPHVEEAILEEPRVFEGWSGDDFGELYSRFGVGGALTTNGVLEAAERMNRNREIHRQVAFLLESPERELLTTMVQVLYQRVTSYNQLSDQE